MNKGYEVTIKKQLKHDFHFIDYPDDINEGNWKDPSGKYNPIINMDLTHVSNCISKIAFSIKKLKASPKPEYVKDFLISLAQKKIEEFEKYKREYDT